MTCVDMGRRAGGPCCRSLGEQSGRFDADLAAAPLLCAGKPGALPGLGAGGGAPVGGLPAGRRVAARRRGRPAPLRQPLGVGCAAGGAACAACTAPRVLAWLRRCRKQRLQPPTLHPWLTCPHPAALAAPATCLQPLCPTPATPWPSSCLGRRRWTPCLRWRRGTPRCTRAERAAATAAARTRMVTRTCASLWPGVRTHLYCCCILVYLCFLSKAM